MTFLNRLSGFQILAGAIALTVVAGAGGYGVARLVGPPGAATPTPAEGGRNVLYWYDPMVPTQRFEKPGKSPFMDMQLVPRYADETQQAGLRIDAASTQNLGARIVAVQSGLLASGVTTTGLVDFNQRDVAIVQARASGFVQRVYRRAPGDVIAAGAPLADILVPEWAGAQTEFLAVRRTGDLRLIQAARQRLGFLGMSPALVAQVERTGRVQTVVTVSTPTGGVIRTLGVRAGMTVVGGQTLAEINGLGSVWVNAALPEALSGEVRVGGPVTVTLTAFPRQTFNGRVSAILPEVQGESRTLTARIELANRDGRLRPGMFATVQFGGGGRLALLVPTEAVIRTGRRTVVMLAQPGGRYQPAEVRVGDEAGGRTEILAGLAEGEKVVASGQFLIDSEASLASVPARPIGGAPTAAALPSLYETVGRVEKLAAGGATLSHDPVPALGWPAMTMLFRVEDPALIRGFKVGDRVTFAFDRPPTGPTLRRMSREPGR